MTTDEAYLNLIKVLKKTPDDVSVVSEAENILAEKFKKISIEMIWTFVHNDSNPKIFEALKHAIKMSNKTQEFHDYVVSHLLNKMPEKLLALLLSKGFVFDADKSEDKNHTSILWIIRDDWRYSYAIPVTRHIFYVACNIATCEMRWISDIKETSLL